MIASLIDGSLRNRIFILFGGLLLLAWGAFEARRMPVDVFPDLTAPSVTVVTEAHGMAPEEVETLIAFPLETALNGAPGVRRVRSTSSVGIAVVIVEFAWGTDIHQARQIVAERVATVRSQLPPEIPEPTLAPITSIMGEILFIALHSDRHTPMELKTAADFTLRRRLLAVPGVAEVIPNGGETRQFQVLADPLRLAAFGVSLEALVAAVEASNENTSAGFYLENGQEFLIHGRGRVQHLDDIARIFVVQRGERPVLVGDVAEVRIGAAASRGTASFNGEPAVVIGIQKQPGANTLALTRQIDTVLDDIQSSLPEGMTISANLFRQSDFISVSIGNLGRAIVEGMVLVIAIVFAFLLSGRATLITLLAIPLSLAAAILAMKAAGIGINTMTLGGMAIALGALVDDAIIVVENIVRRMRENATLPTERQRGLLPLVLAATREIQGSVVFATLIIALVFLPIFALTGIEGRLMQPLGFAYVVSLLASLVVAVTITPVLCSLLLPASKIVREGHESRLSRWLKRRYQPLLEASLSRWRVIAVLSVLGTLLTLAALMGAGRAFLPDFNEGSLTVSVTTLPGTSLAESSALGQRVEKILLEQPEVVATGRRTGRAELDPHAQEIYASEIEVTLAMQERSKQDFLAHLREEFSGISGAQVVIGQPISHRIDHMLSGTRANIAIKLFGNDLYELRRIGQQIEDEVTTIPGAVDVNLEQQSELPFITIDFDRLALARYGLSVREASHNIETAFFGSTVSRVLEGNASVDLVVRMGDEVRQSVEAMQALRIDAPSGVQVPLSAIARVERSRGPNQIGRENVQRRIIVMANVAGRDLGGVVDEARERIEANIALPPGYHIEYGGQFESAAEASRTLMILGSVVMAGIFLLLYLAFSSTRDALLVMLNLPLALLGGVAGVWLSGGVLSVASIIGFITLFGIATRNGVMLIAHIHHLAREEGVDDAIERVRRGAAERLVPITMTALATALALVPLALSAGQPGSEIQAPMAMVILAGLLSSTVLNMLVLPSLYLRFGSFGRHRA
ncbi:efflux RND transporter permease subunit [Silanimonas sp.]|uniref:efflux RND transporter permease subunit n=1 Tax=Silanimonas sp. TaxID=1929290 RepID=UPI001BC70060|nr:efflux RND transporter permease subunit [Silanimonas sp.]MBS3895841.1 efflux RND transporter permease subunit [Silanimonas sp.]MBS3924854.1 efflux RND transporter permease subunit [Xanthomonadaceae bacterium]